MVGHSFIAFASLHPDPGTRDQSISYGTLDADDDIASTRKLTPKDRRARAFQI